MTTSVEEKIRLQEQLAKRLVFEPFDLRRIRFVAGADTAYWADGDGELGVCCVVVVDAEAARRTSAALAT